MFLTPETSSAPFIGNPCIWMEKVKPTQTANLTLTSRDAKASRENTLAQIIRLFSFHILLERHIMLIDDNVDKRNNTSTTDVAVDWIGKDGSLGGVK